MHACMHGTCGHFCRPCCATLLHTLPVQALLRRCCYSYASLLLPTLHIIVRGLRANKKGGTGSLKKIRKSPKMKLFRGHPVPGPRRAGNLSRKPRLSSHLVPARAVACRS